MGEFGPLLIPSGAGAELRAADRARRFPIAGSCWDCSGQTPVLPQLSAAGADGAWRWGLRAGVALLDRAPCEDGCDGRQVRASGSWGRWRLRGSRRLLISCMWSLLRSVCALWWQETSVGVQLKLVLGKHQVITCRKQAERYNCQDERYLLCKAVPLPSDHIGRTGLPRQFSALTNDFLLTVLILY